MPHLLNTYPFTELNETENILYLCSKSLNPGTAPGNWITVAQKTSIFICSLLSGYFAGLLHFSFCVLFNLFH